MRGQGLDLHATIAKHLLDCTRAPCISSASSCATWTSNGRASRVTVGPIFEHAETMIFTAKTQPLPRG